MEIDLSIDAEQWLLIVQEAILNVATDVKKMRMAMCCCWVEECCDWQIDLFSFGSSYPPEPLMYRLDAAEKLARLHPY